MAAPSQSSTALASRELGTQPIAPSLAQATYRRWQSPRYRRRVLAFFLFLLPWLIGFLAFQAIPMLVSAFLLFNQYDILTPPKWIGLQNIQRMFGEDDLFWKSLRVTGVYTFIVVPLHIMIGYALALLLNRCVRFLSFWRTVYYAPAIVPVVASSYLWSWLLNKDFGAINGALSTLGLAGPNWLGHEEWVLPAFIMMSAWGSGGGIVLYLAAMQQVPTSLYDAAKVDGANAWQRLRHITIPMTTFIIFFTFVTGLIGTFQVFAAGYILTNGGPDNASLFYVLYLYRVGWQYLEMGYAAALAWFLFLVILLLTIVVLLTSRLWVYYEGDERGA